MSPCSHLNQGTFFPPLYSTPNNFLGNNLQYKWNCHIKCYPDDPFLEISEAFSIPNVVVFNLMLTDSYPVSKAQIKCLKKVLDDL